ncbi:MAG TPA: DUF4124 domain-containing protein [Burkholderiales bacterium]|nr:DUF4124 domain-containing protein [Burkholderiales bacterium]
MIRALLLVLACGFSAASLAQYKWTDKSGRVQYGDTPPPGVNATPLRPAPAPAAAPAAKKGAATTAEKDAEFRKRQLEAAKAREKEAQLAQEAGAKKENCERARASVRSIEGGQRISRTDEKGERHFLDEAQTAQELARARQSVQSWCG